MQEIAAIRGVPIGDAFASLPTAGRIDTALDHANDAAREPFAGIGKPEPLRGNLAGYWSRRIDDTHRLVYRATDTELVVIACRFHYDG